MRRAPAGTPAPIVRQLNALLREVLKDPKLVETTRRQGLNPVTSTPEEFAQFIRDDLQRWRPVITERG